MLDMKGSLAGKFSAVKKEVRQKGEIKDYRSLSCQTFKIKFSTVEKEVRQKGEIKDYRSLSCQTFKIKFSAVRGQTE